MPKETWIIASVLTAVLLVVKALFPPFRAVLSAMLEHGAQGATGIAAPLIYLLFSLAMINVVLCVFNLIPIPPLDGSHVVGALLPPAWHWRWAQLERYGFLLIFGALWTGVLNILLRPFVTGLLWILLS